MNSSDKWSQHDATISIYHMMYLFSCSICIFVHLSLEYSHRVYSFFRSFSVCSTALKQTHKWTVYQTRILVKTQQICFNHQLFFNLFLELVTQVSVQCIINIHLKKRCTFIAKHYVSVYEFASLYVYIPDKN